MAAIKEESREGSRDSQASAPHPSGYSPHLSLNSVNLGALPVAAPIHPAAAAVPSHIASAVLPSATGTVASNTQERKSNSNASSMSVPVPVPALSAQPVGLVDSSPNHSDASRQTFHDGSVMGSVANSQTGSENHQG